MCVTLSLPLSRFVSLFRLFALLSLSLLYLAISLSISLLPSLLSSLLILSLVIVSLSLHFSSHSSPLSLSPFYLVIVSQLSLPLPFPISLPLSLPLHFSLSLLHAFLCGVALDPSILPLVGRSTIFLPGTIDNYQ